MNWAEMSLDRVADIQNSGVWGSDPDGGQYDTPVVRTSDIDRQGRIKFDRLPTRKLTPREYDRAACQCGDILVVKSSGSHTNVVTGKPCLVVDTNGRLAFTNFLMRLRPNRALVDPEYLYHYLWSPAVLGSVRRMIATTTYPNLKIPEYRAVSIPVPPIEEQRKITGKLKECLQRVEEIELLQESLIEEVGQFWPSYFISAEASSPWPKAKVGDVILDSRNGRSIKSTSSDGNGWVLTLSAVRSPRMNFGASKIINLDDRTARTYRIEKDDVFVSRANTIDLVGLSAFAEAAPASRLIYPDLLIRLKVKSEQIRPNFLAIALRFPSCRRQIQSFAKGTSQSMVKIAGSELREVQVPCPPLDIQDRFLAQLTEIRISTEGILNEFDDNALQALKDSVLRQAFTGGL